MTSGQYSYMLMRHLQRNISCSDSEHRAYLYNFFGGIFTDPSVVLDEASYNNSLAMLDNWTSYCAEKNLYSFSSIYYDENWNQIFENLQSALAAIGITIELSVDSDNYPISATFTLPSGEQRVWEIMEHATYGMSLYLNSQMRVSDEYRVKMLPYFNLEDVEPLDLAEDGVNAAGYNTRWEYDAATKTLQISGNGTLADSALWELLGITDISTIIIGAGVYRLLMNSLDFTNITIVDLHGEADEIMLEMDRRNDAGFNGAGDRHFYGDPKTARSWVFYTDNQTLRNVEYEGADIEWHTLAEWEG